MSLKTKTAKEQLSLQTNAEETSQDSKALISYHKIEGSPFTHIEEPDKGHYLVMGNYRLTRTFDTAEELHEYINVEQWNIIGGMIAAHIDFNNNLQQNKN